MTPHPQPHSRRVHVPRDLLRRSAALLATALVIVGTPLVASAIGDEFVPLVVTAPVQPEPWFAVRAVPSIPNVPDPRAGLDADPVRTPALAASPEAAASESASPDTATEPNVDPVFALLSDTYVWDERSDRVALLQRAVGLDVDGWYSDATQRAHRAALEFVGLPIDGLPAPLLPPGPDPGEWAALRQCESGGDYSIANPSGAYRGAYQFGRSTWNSVAEQHAPHLVGVDPAAASPADQDAMALALYSEQGARPWPHCGRHLS